MAGLTRGAASFIEQLNPHWCPPGTFYDFNRGGGQVFLCWSPQGLEARPCGALVGVQGIPSPLLYQAFLYLKLSPSDYLKHQCTCFLRYSHHSLCTPSSIKSKDGYWCYRWKKLRKTGSCFPEIIKSGRKFWENMYIVIIWLQIIQIGQNPRN